MPLWRHSFLTVSIVAGLRWNRHENCPQKGENCALKLYKFFGRKEKSLPRCGEGAVQSLPSQGRWLGEAETERLSRICDNLSVCFADSSPSRGASGETVDLAGIAKASPTRRGGTTLVVTERLYEEQLLLKLITLVPLTCFAKPSGLPRGPCSQRHTGRPVGFQRPWQWMPRCVPLRYGWRRRSRP